MYRLCVMFLFALMENLDFCLSDLAIFTVMRTETEWPVVSVLKAVFEKNYIPWLQIWSHHFPPVMILESSNVFFFCHYPQKSTTHITTVLWMGNGFQSDQAVQGVRQPTLFCRNSCEWWVDLLLQWLWPRMSPTPHMWALHFFVLAALHQEFCKWLQLRASRSPPCVRHLGN